MTRWTPAIVLALLAPLLHAEIVSPVIPDGLGVNIHFTDPKPGEMKQIADAGFKFVRMDFDWNRIEAEKGKYDFAPYDRLVAACEEHGIRILFILDYVNRHYDDARSPDTDEGRAAFAKWAAASVQHFRGRKILWEMYNEPNIHPFWRPRVNHDDYVKLALAVGKAIREVAPEEYYVGPASAGIELEFLETCFKGGLLEYFDAITVHPYRQQDPEGVAADYRKLRMLIRKYAPKDKQIPIFSGEWGYSSIWSAYDDERQGKMLPRQWLTNIANDVNLSIWYDWHDDGPDPKEPEHHFGTVKLDYAPKPAYLAAKTLTKELAGYTFNKRLLGDDPGDYLLLFTKGENVKAVAWTTAKQPRSFALPASSLQFDVTDHLGKSQRIVGNAPGGLSIDLTDAPQYILPLQSDKTLKDVALFPRTALEIVLSRDDDWIANNWLTRGSERRWVPTTWPSALLLNPLLSPQTVIEAEHPTIGPEPYRVRVVQRNNPGEPGQWRVAQESYVVISDPLSLEFLPRVRNVVPVRVSNPAGRAFHGRLINSGTAEGRGTQEPVHLADGRTETTLLLSAPQASDAGEYRMAVDLLDQKDQKLISLTSRFAPVELHGDDYQLVAEGDPKVASTQTFEPAKSPAGLPLEETESIRIDYSFDAGWKFICLKPKPEALQKINGKPEKLGLWVKGDKSGNIPRLRITDSTGQTFQPDGPRLSFADWRYVEFNLTGDKSGHWGGANDGKIHYPIKFETLFLLDSGKGDKTQGSVYINSPTLIYAE